MSKKGSVLHELLAVDADLDGAHKKILAETKKTFKDKEGHFLGMHKKLEVFSEDDKIDYPETNKQMVTTVAKKLTYMSKTEVRYFDSMLQKELTNQVAVADLVVDGKVIATGIPATFCLGMETRLKHLRDVYGSIPTLAPGVSWMKDSTLGEDIYKEEFPAEKLKTETIIEPVVLYKHTPEHPAQIKEMSKVVNVGKYITKVTSGMLSPADKSVLLERIDKLIRAFKQARQRANTTTVVKRNIGKELFSYINDK